MSFQFGGDSFGNGSKETSSWYCSSFPFPKPQPAPPPSVFDFSDTKLSNFTNFPATHHSFHPGMVAGPAGVAQGALFLPVFILPVMQVLISGSFAVAVPISQFPGSMALSFTEVPKAPVFGHACNGFPTTLSSGAGAGAGAATKVGSAAFPPPAIFGGPSSATAKKVESATLLQPASYGGCNAHVDEGFWC